MLNRQISFADQVADRMSSQNFKSTTETIWPSTPSHNVTLTFDMSTTQNFSALPITQADPSPQGIDHVTTERSEDVSPEVSQARPNDQEQDPRSDLQENDPGIRGGRLRANATPDTSRDGPAHGNSSSELRYGISDCDSAGVQVSAAAFASTENQGGDSIEEHEVESQEQDWSNRYTPVHEPGDQSWAAVVERYAFEFMQHSKTPPRRCPIARQTKDYSYRDLIKKINVLRTEKGYPLIPEDVLARDAHEQHPVLIPVLECDSPGTRRWWEYDERMSNYKEELRLMNMEVRIIDMIMKGRVPSMNEEEEELLKKDLEAVNEGRAALFGEEHTQPQLDITKSIWEHFPDLEQEHEEEEEEAPEEVQERIRQFNENWDSTVAENQRNRRRDGNHNSESSVSSVEVDSSDSDEDEEAPETSEREENATATGQNTIQEVIEISSNEGSPRATLGSYDSLMGTTTDSETANVRRDMAGRARLQEIQAEGRALDISTSDNNTDPRTRRRKLSQARNLPEEGCTSEPMEIEVSTENLTPRQALTLELKQHAKFCTDVSDFFTKLEICLQCPLSYQTYVRPMLGPDGNTYEEQFIIHWL